MNAPPEQLKEYRIATEALGRSAGYDPHYDSSVRVQVGRLREKLDEYYGSTGTHDPILIEIPKGKYTLSFRIKPVQFPATSLKTTGEPEGGLIPPAASLSKSVRLGSAFLLGSLITLGTLALVSNHTRITTPIDPSTIQAQQKPTALERFWAPFVNAQREPYVIFKNQIFIGDAVNGMHLSDPSADSGKRGIQDYTGVGEVMGTVEIAQLFDKLGVPLRLKRDGLFTIDDARGNNLVFVGSPHRDLRLSEIPGTHEFMFQRTAIGRYRSRTSIMDSHPQNGGKAVYARSYEKDGVELDYAIVALKRGIDPSRWTLFLEGTSTEATQAAVEYVCSEHSAALILDHLQLRNGALVKPFESILRVKVVNDVPVDTELLDLRETSD